MSIAEKIARDFAAVNENPASLAINDDSTAQHFTKIYADKRLYVALWSCWMVWTGARWERDSTHRVFDDVRRVCRIIALEAGGRDSQAHRLLSAQTVAAVERLARADRAHACDAEVFDSNGWILNTPEGVIDLRTGSLRPGTTKDYCTKVTAVAPGGECPRWRAFLKEITQGDAEVVAYLQRWAGYMLTGETREHAFLVLIGPGGNGKTLLVNVLSFVMGDYAATAPMETFMSTNGERHPTDVAGMRGARLVIAQETEAGRSLAEAKIKTLTGGDPVSARFMRGDFFTYRPTFKLVMVGNHRPEIRNADNALRRRLHLLPLTFMPDHPDPALFEALKAEAAGILQWAVDGCRAWQAEGLGMPAAVRAATADYFADQDLLIQWLAERCEVRRDARAPSSALFRDWSDWCEARGERPGTNKWFSSALERHHAKERSRDGTIFSGLRLRPSVTGVL